jgi:LDH2 family malate/lactate/ureidoglycolate dehydrogenase
LAFGFRVSYTLSLLPVVEAFVALLTGISHTSHAAKETQPQTQTKNPGVGRVLQSINIDIVHMQFFQPGLPYLSPST